MKPEFSPREYPMFSACGLNCGLCPRYQMVGTSKCPGCGAKDFLTKHPKCGPLSCSQRKGFEYCYQCGEFPCKRYDGADQTDSFITHRHQLRDMEKANRMGMDGYKTELDQKIAILEHLLAHYNDGRRKNLFCVVINLLELEDILYVIEQITEETQPELSTKEKAAVAAHLLQQMAEKRDISLKLRKK